MRPPDRDIFGTSRGSRLFPDQGLVHADLHNHSHFSDGRGDPAQFYRRIGQAGIDVAALTDHATAPDTVYGPDVGPGPACFAPPDWDSTGVLADAATTDGEFVALRGFEWSSPLAGHSNVWFSSGWTSPLGVIPPSLAHPGHVSQSHWDDDQDGVEGFHSWLKRSARERGRGGGSDGLFGFNHPGREPGRFGRFRCEPTLRPRMVSIEMFNKTEDFLYQGLWEGGTSPLVECLDAGWQPGIIGTSDEHDPDWGQAVGKGRAGLWVTELSRRGVREALQARRFYATREKGLRIDAAANGRRMGGIVDHTDGPVRFQVDIAQFDVADGSAVALVDPTRGRSVPPVGMAGQRLVMQVLQTGRPLPSVVWQGEVTVPGPDQPVLEIEVDIHIGNGAWVVVRLCDPSQAQEAHEIPGSHIVPTDSPYRRAGRAVAYTSPWFLSAAVRATPPAPISS